MNYHNFNIHNKTFMYIGAILVSVGTYLDTTNKADTFVVLALLISGIVFTLLCLKKPKENKEEES